MIGSNAFTSSVKTFYSKADQHTLLDLFHHAPVYSSEIPDHPLLVYGPYLFKLNHRKNTVITDPADIYMRRLPGILFDPGRDRRYDQGGTVPVADIVLKNDDRPFASLL
jgi:hypothetical protein